MKGFSFIKQILLILSIYFVVWIPLYKTSVYNQTDSLWSIYTTISIVEENNLDLEEYRELFPKAFNANLHFVNSKAYNYYPYGVSLLAAPYIVIAEYWYALKGKKLSEKVKNSSTIFFEKYISSSLLAMSSCLFFLISLKITQSYTKSLFTVFLFSFCTIILSTVSRGLWQHTGSIFLLSLVLFFFISKSKILLILSALPLYFSYIVRPTNVLSIFFLSLVALYYLRGYAFYFLCIGLFVLITFFYLNFNIFLSLNHPYYDFKKVGGSDKFLEALIGNLISPGRGLFIFSPVFFFIFWGIYYKYKREALTALDFGMFSIIILHWILISRNLNWWGGHSFGYRLFSDLIPFLVFYLIYFLKFLNFKSISFGIFIITVVLSFYINVKGATNMETYYWNLKPNNIDLHPERNWDWNDMLFLR